MSLDLYQKETAERLASLKPVMTLESEINSIAYILGTGAGASLLFFPLAYLALSRQFGFKFNNAKIAVLFGITVVLVGTINLLIETLFGKNTVTGYMDMFTALLLPLAVSGVVVYVAHKRTRHSVEN